MQKLIIPLILMSFLTEGFHAERHRIERREKYPTSHKILDPQKYSINGEPKNINSVCLYIQTQPLDSKFTLEAQAIQKENDDAANWYGISYANGMIGAVLLLSGGIWWASGGPAWLFLVGLGQHGSAYFTGYYAGVLGRDARDRTERLVDGYNALFDTQTYGSRGIVVTLRF